ncbi:TRAP-type mannitol/chloroaromatic compound transport system, substrate-binding protein [Sulfurivirga caldicuralii]|uniref:TRAP-type mannitol/chloroaromatic compound transport system, substrate-binding protein n=1 Tax=Sulfurivirga caldicuralii TaxID=364032 RepID=A0A1N6DHE2_9GAMM|nr:TRAP transporter substrate-binding protein [Sulfurivirga caldicuralii]SIN70188.1 TRAP-type mannitol/chloroaromatic compound transport system, substrate-binding protein [Sulfurivirga caldicuralii]
MSDRMKRRELLGAVAGAAAATTLSACGKNDEAPKGVQPPVQSSETFHWKMVTTWPKNFPGLGTGANRLAELIEQLSGGRITVKVFGAGELVGAFEAFDAVSRGTAQIGHGGAYYWKGKIPAAPFFSAIPFGFTPDEINAWFYKADGVKLWHEAYKPFGLIPFPAGNTGPQMGGWFNKEINSLEDIKGLKMRIPGFGGEVLKRAGGIPVTLPGGELFQAMQSGAIDATEWVGPYNDLAFGFYKVAKYYYTPGWHEPGSAMEAIVNADAFARLPKDLQLIVENACKIVNLEMLAEYTARNQQALQTLVEKHGVQLRRFPDDVLKKFRELTLEVIADVTSSDPMAAKVWASQKAFLARVRKWTNLSELSFLKARDEM